MALDEITTFTATCDRCGERRTLPEDPRNEDRYNGGWEYWRGRRSNVGHLWLLCPSCVNKTYRFMDGMKTPAGIRFNSGEDFRLVDPGA